jgi:trimethylamine--corrinoid protein Co-methyltransferase
MDSLREVPPGGHHLDTPHTINHFQDAFHRADLMDYKDIDQWVEEGSITAAMGANSKVKALLESYQAPTLDESLDQDLQKFIKHRKEQLTS